MPLANRDSLNWHAPMVPYVAPNPGGRGQGRYLSSSVAYRYDLGGDGSLGGHGGN